jgi:hypothetical protein
LMVVTFPILKAIGGHTETEGNKMLLTATR